MNYGDIQARVQTNIIDLPTKVQAAVPDLVQAAHRTLQRKHNFFIMKAEAVANTAPSTRLLTAFPVVSNTGEWKEKRGRPYAIDGTTSLPYDLQWGEEKEAVRFWTPADTGNPRLLTEESDGIHVWPLTDSASQNTGGEYEVHIPYFKYLPAPTQGADEDWFLANAYEYIIFRASADGFFMNWDEAHGQLWDQRATVKYQEAVVADKGRWLAGLDTFVPHLGAKGPRLGL